MGEPMLNHRDTVGSGAFLALNRPRRFGATMPRSFSTSPPARLDQAVRSPASSIADSQASASRTLGLCVSRRA